jgi:uncharacterized protein with ATP-grasp and redox domains
MKRKPLEGAEIITLRDGSKKIVRPIFFLLKTKCEVIAKHIGAKKGDFVLKGNSYEPP